MIQESFPVLKDVSFQTGRSCQTPRTKNTDPHRSPSLSEFTTLEMKRWSHIFPGYKDFKLRMASDSSIATLESREQWHSLNSEGKWIPT